MQEERSLKSRRVKKSETQSAESTSWSTYLLTHYYIVAGGAYWFLKHVVFCSYSLTYSVLNGPKLLTEFTLRT